MDERDEKIVSAVAGYMWDEMAQMRQRGLTHLEGDLRVEEGVLKAEVRGVDSRPAESITLTFSVGDCHADPSQKNRR